MANNLLKATISVDAPNITQTATKVSAATDKMQKGLTKLGGASVNATGDLINLGRIIQDAPFGILGFANNLNPAIEGLGRTAKAAGGATGLFKALGKSLLGAGGLSLAISAVSTGLLLFGDRLFGASEGASALREASEKLGADVAKDLTQLATLVGLIQNVKTSNEDRAKGIKALKQEYGDYLKDLGIEEIALGNIQSAYEAITKSILQQAVIKGAQEEIAAAVKDTAAQIIRLRVEQEKVRIAAEKAITPQQKQSDNLKILEGNLRAFNRASTDGVLAQAGMANSMQATNDESAGLQGQIDRLTKELFKTLEPLQRLTTSFGDLGIELNKPKSDKSLDNIIAKAKEVAAFLEKNTLFEVTYEFNPLDDKATAVKKAQKFLDDVAAGNLKFRKLPIEFGSFIPPSAETVQRELTKLEEGFKKGIFVPVNLEIPETVDEARVKLLNKYEDQLKKIGLQLYTIAGVKGIDLFKITPEQLDNFVKGLIEVQRVTEAIKNEVEQGLTTAFENMFQAIFTGGDGLKSFLKSLTQSITQLIARLAAAAVVAGLLSLLTGGRAGSFTGLFGKLAGFRASGGPVMAGQSYVVGERGAEVFTPNTGGSITSNASLAQFGRVQPSTLQVTGELVARGGALVAVISQATRSQNTLG